MPQFFIEKTDPSMINFLCSWWCWCLTVFGPIATMVVAVVFATWIVDRARYIGLHSLLLLLLLSNHLSCIKLNQHSPVCFELLNGHRQPKIVEEKELKFKVIEFDKRKPSNLV
jgi:hypothetical protein